MHSSAVQAAGRTGALKRRAGCGGWDGGTDTLPIQSPWGLGASSFPCLSCKSLAHCCASLVCKLRDMQSDGNGRADL